MINKSYSSLSDREAISGASGVFKGWNIASVILGAFSFIVGIAALPLRLILRNNLGERSVRPFSLVLAIAIHIYYFTEFYFLIGIISMISVDGNAFEGMGYEAFLYVALFVLVNPYSLFLIWALVRGVKHFKQKIKEAQNDEVGYTYYRGESRFFANWDKPEINGFKTDQEFIRMLAEPKAVMVIGLAMAITSALFLVFLVFIVETESAFLTATIASFLATGLVIVLDAFCLAIDEINLKLSKRDKVLDILDSEEDAKTIVSQKDDMKARRKNDQSNSGNDDETSDDFVIA